MGFTGKPHDLHVAGSAIGAYLTEINSLVKNIIRFVASQQDIGTHTIDHPSHKCGGLTGRYCGGIRKGQGGRGLMLRSLYSKPRGGRFGVISERDRRVGEYLAYFLTLSTATTFSVSPLVSRGG